jgi:hypothetical protein
MKEQDRLHFDTGGPVAAYVARLDGIEEAGEGESAHEAYWDLIRKLQRKMRAAEEFLRLADKHQHQST